MSVLFRRAAMVLLLIAVALPAFAGAEPPRIENPAHAPVRETLALREVWRVGGDDESAVLLGQVGVVVSGPDGEVYALDTQLAQVQVFDRAGGLLRTIGREGDGPGEFRQPVGLFLPGDGTVGIQQPFPGRVVYLDAADGTPRGSWKLGKDDPAAGGFGFIELARRRGGTFAVAASNAAFDMEAREIRNTSFLAVIGDDGHERGRLAERSSVRSLVRFTVDELAEYHPGERGRWDVGPDGNVYVAARYDAHDIAVHAPDGALLRTIARPYEARLRTEQEREEQRESMRMNINGMEPQIDWKLQDRNPCIDQLRVLDDGSIWIRDSHGAVDWEDHGRMVYNVFGPDGRLAREVTIAIPEGGSGDRLILLDDGRLMLVKGMAGGSISISAGDGDDEGSQELETESHDTLLELVCFEIDR